MNDDNKEEGQKPMKLPRFSYQVPEDLTTDFLQEMKSDHRESPGDLLTAIIRKYFQIQTEERMLKQFPTESLEERQAIPHYGPKPSTSDRGQIKSQSAGEE